MVGKIYVTLLILLVAGCAAQPAGDHSSVSRVSEGLKERTDYELGQSAEPGLFNLPEGVSLDDGLSQDEAVALALWNNARFQADLAALGFARADLVEAGMLSNPVFSLLFPVGPKLLETNLSFAIDVLWQRPHRIAAAKLDSEGLSENLVEHGLALIRDVRIAYADLQSALERADLAREDAELRVQMAELAQVRLRAGDVSELEASVAHVDLLKAVDAERRLLKEAVMSEQRLCALLGLIAEKTAFHITASDTAPRSAVSVDELLKTAFAARPDLRAAELKIEAAGERIGWEKSKVYNFIAIIDAKDEGEDSLTVGPALEAEIPIFNQNDGGIARARAELEQATRQYEAVRQNVILQVRQAHTQYVSAHEEFELWSGDIVPSVEQTLERTRKSLDAGEVTRLSVFEVQQTLSEARMRQTELAAELARNTAQLNYCVGKRVIETKSDNSVKPHD